MFSLDPGRRSYVTSAFVQDEFAFRAGRLRLTLGTKLERNDYSGGLEFLPSVRLALQPSDRHAAWLAVTRAVRNAVAGRRGRAADGGRPAEQPAHAAGDLRQP